MATPAAPAPRITHGAAPGPADGLGDAVGKTRAIVRVEVVGDAASTTSRRTSTRASRPATTSTSRAAGRKPAASTRTVAAELTQAALAERAGLDVSYVSQMERGLRDPSLSSIESLAGALGLSLAEFFDDAGAEAGVNLARSLAAELAVFDTQTRRDAVEILRRFRAAVERAAPRRRRGG